MVIAAIILGALPDSALIERFRMLAHAEQQVTKCAHLDRSAAARARVRLARSAAASVSARASAASTAGRRAWVAMKDGVDDSCIVGPGETGRSSYRDMIAYYERTTRETAAAIPKGR